MKKEELLQLPVSFYLNMKSSSPKEMTIGRVENGIVGDFYASQIKQIRLLREMGKKEEADELKTNLHAVTFCATFKKRRMSSLYENYNNVMVMILLR